MSIEDELRADLLNLGDLLAHYIQIAKEATAARIEAESSLPRLVEEERSAAFALSQATQARERIQRDYEIYRRKNSEEP